MIYFVPTREQIRRGAIEVGGATEEKVEEVFVDLDKEYGEGGNKIISENIPGQFPEIRNKLFKEKYSWKDAKYKNTYTNVITQKGFEYGKLLVEVENHGELFYFTIELVKILIISG